jgi:hypothetical protein
MCRCSPCGGGGLNSPTSRPTRPRRRGRGARARKHHPTPPHTTHTLANLRPHTTPHHSRLGQPAAEATQKAATTSKSPNLRSHKDTREEQRVTVVRRDVELKEFGEVEECRRHVEPEEAARGASDSANQDKHQHHAMQQCLPPALDPRPAIHEALATSEDSGALRHGDAEVATPELVVSYTELRKTKLPLGQ